jgi:hypothetical protein
MWPEESYGREENGLKLLEVNHLIVMHINAPPLCVCTCVFVGLANTKAIIGRCAWTQGIPTTSQVFP